MAGRLFALPPSEFTAARAAEAAAVKRVGDAALAREIAGLRRPTVSAWAVNRLAREHPDEPAELLSVGQELRAAWQAQDAEALAGAEREHGERAEKVARLEAGLAEARKRLAESAQRLEVTRREERQARRRLEE